MGDSQPVALRRAPARPTARRVTLVRPTILAAKMAYSSITCPPIGLAYLTARLIADGHEVTAIDSIGEAITQFLPTDDPRYLAQGLSPEEIAARVDPQSEVVGVSCMFSHDWPECQRVIAAIRRAVPDALIVAGGEHVTAVPEDSLDDCPEVDLVVVGEGEETLAELVALGGDADRLPEVHGLVLRRPGGGYAHTPPRARNRAIDEIPLPAWDRLPLENYLDAGYGFGVHRGRSLPVLASRGCPYQCTFCSNPVMWTTRYVTRSPALLLAEIKAGMARYGTTNVDFYDLTMIVRKSWIVEFCNLVIADGARFTWQLPSGTRSEALDDEVLPLLYAAGCRNLTYAPESGSPEVLRRIKKKVDLDRMKASISSGVAVGINCNANIIIGFPDETRAEVRETLRFIVDLALIGLHDVSLAAFSPYPGSELFEELRAAGQIPDLDDDYFRSLSYVDLSLTPSYSPHFGSRELRAYRAAGLLLFFAVSFARRPWRLLDLGRRLATSDTQESRLEQALGDITTRLTTSARRAVTSRRRAARRGVGAAEGAR